MPTQIPEIVQANSEAILLDYRTGMPSGMIQKKYCIGRQALRGLISRTSGLEPRPVGNPHFALPSPASQDQTATLRAAVLEGMQAPARKEPPTRKFVGMRETGMSPGRVAMEAELARRAQQAPTPTPTPTPAPAPASSSSKPPKGARWGDPVPHVVDYKPCAWYADGTPKELTKEQKYVHDFTHNQLAEEKAAGYVSDVHVH